MVGDILLLVVIVLKASRLLIVEREALAEVNDVVRGSLIANVFPLLINWEPHRLIGPDPETRASISTSKTLIPSGQLPSDLPTSTSRGHQPKVPRPSRVGLGWGDHDHFQEWRIHGRALTEDIADDKEWLYEDPPTIQTVRPRTEAAEGAEGFDVTVSLSSAGKPEAFEDKQKPKTVLNSFRTRGNGESSAQARGRASRGIAHRGPGLVSLVHVLDHGHIVRSHFGSHEVWLSQLRA